MGLVLSVLRLTFRPETPMNPEDASENHIVRRQASFVSGFVRKTDFVVLIPYL